MKEIFEDRSREYREYIEKYLKDFYSQRDKLRLVEGNQSIEGANRDILKAIGAKV